jgi:hypothetical protein
VVYYGGNRSGRDCWSKTHHMLQIITQVCRDEWAHCGQADRTDSVHTHIRTIRINPCPAKCGWVCVCALSIIHFCTVCVHPINRFCRTATCDIRFIFVYVAYTPRSPPYFLHDTKAEGIIIFVTKYWATCGRGDDRNER